jgi:hypothetical protein
VCVCVRVDGLMDGWMDGSVPRHVDARADTRGPMRSLTNRPCPLSAHMSPTHRAHTLLLDGKGGAYACGSDFWYQLGLGETWKVTKERPEAFFAGEKKERGEGGKGEWVLDVGGGKGGIH